MPHHDSTLSARYAGRGGSGGCIGDNPTGSLELIAVLGQAKAAVVGLHDTKDMGITEPFKKRDGLVTGGSGAGEENVDA